MRKIRWSDLCPHAEAVHTSSASQSTAGSWSVHDHDFNEVFWVESGVGLHLRGDGVAPRRLVAGQIVYIRWHDCHGFSTVGTSEPFTIINVAFPLEAWEELKDRYALENHPLMDDEAAEPPTLEVPTNLKADFSAFFFRVLRRPTTPLTRDAFLLGLLARTGGVDVPVPSSDLPIWFRRGLMDFENDPAQWSGGAAELARLCGCSRVHLARVMQQYLGKTPSQWILDLRLTRAARLLTATGFSITDVASESGFENQSYFHKRFAERYGCTPLQYRKMARREAV